MGFKVNIPQIQAETNCTFFVATNGLDSNDGKSESQSLKTIQAAVNKAAPGDVVCVRTGTYGSLRVYPGQGMGRSGTAQQPIIYRVFGDGPVQLASIWIEGEYVEFRDFKVVGPGRDSNGSVGIFTASRESICCTHFQTNHVKFIGIEVTNFATGILGGGDDLEFREMDIHHNGYYWFEDMGIYLSGARIKIIGNRIHDNASTGIQLWNTSNDPTLVPNHTMRAWLEINRPELLNSVNTNRHGSGFDLPATGIAASNNLTAVDPKFSNRANNDFHLIASSLAIDAGTSQDAPATDFEGTPRPQGNGYDIGADEYGAGSSGSVCGNGVCESGENSSSCPTDCPTTTPRSLTADFNSDNKVDVIDLGIFLSNWGSASKPSADLNQDGKVDVIDLGIMLSNWRI